MGQTNNRNYLLSILYKTIFKEIYPIDVGNALHADKINLFSNQRRLRGYHYDDYAYLGLQVDSAVNNFGFDCDISENNFHNWMQGVANPKYLIIINSILEYLIDTCKDIGKYELLRSRVLMLLKAPEFHQYTGDLIPNLIQQWITRIEANDTEMLYKATKEIMYLLKNKEKFIPYLLKEQNNLITDRIADIPEIIEVTDKHIGLSASSSAPVLLIIAKAVNRLLHSKKVLYSLSVGIILILLLYGDLLLQNNLTVPTKGSDYYSGNETNSAQDSQNTEVVPSNPKDENDYNQTSSNLTTAQDNDAINTGNSPNNDDTPVAVESLSTENTSLSSDPSVSDHSASDPLVSDPLASDPLASEAGDSGAGAIQNSMQSTVNADTGAPSVMFSAATPVILSPANESELDYSDVKVQWEEVPKATSYNIIIANTTSWTTVYTENNYNGTSLVLSKGLFSFAGRYRIYVSSVFEEQASAPGYVDITFEGLRSPTITSPTNDEILPLSDITVNWTPISYVTGYTIAVTNTTTWEYVINEEILPGSSYTLDRSLFLPGQSYRIYLTSVFDAACSDPYYIDIKIKELSSPEVTAPANGEVIPPDDLTLTWLPVSLASGYGVTITDTVSWLNVYTNSDIIGSSLQLDKSLFVPERSYRIYLYSAHGDIYSVPNYIDVTVSK